MKLKKIALILSLSTLTMTASAKSPYSVKTIGGVISHGINTYNGQPIGDYSEASPLTFVNAIPAIEEIGFYQEDAFNAGTITENTDRSLPVATTLSFLNFFNPGGQFDPATVNVPLGQIGNNLFGPSFSAVDQRVLLDDFPELGTEPQPHRRNTLNINPTVGDWEKASGALSVVTKKGVEGSTVFLTIRNGFPNALYTMWDVGARNPLTPEEEGYAVPLGGVPNVLTTNDKGCGFAKVDVSYDVLRECKAGAESCTSYIAGFYHWDGQLYGASPAATWAGAATGIYAGNQMVWPTSGKLLIEPQNDFSPAKHGCY